MPDEIRQHLNWIKGYCDVANERNYLDMLLMIERQIQQARECAEKAT